MLRLVSAFMCLLLPVAAHARCEGTDMISQMGVDERAALQAQADAQPYPSGLLWQAVRGDSRITLFGTYHFRHEQTQAHLDQLKPRIDAADAVYLEVSNADQKEMERVVANDLSIMFITEGPSLIDLLGPDDWQRLSAELELRGIPGFMAAKFKPMWASLMLGIGPCETKYAMTNGKGIDALIGDYAAQIGNPSQSLEDFRTLVTLLDDLPIEDQLDMIRLFLAWTGDADDLAYTLRQRYLAQQTALIWEFSRFVTETMNPEGGADDFELLESSLLDGRNHSWMTVLLDQPAGHHLFVAVGAAHLPGQEGLLYLLEQQGYTITPQEF